jgi:hypothetical protein
MGGGNRPSRGAELEGGLCRWKQASAGFKHPAWGLIASLEPEVRSHHAQQGAGRQKPAGKAVSWPTGLMSPPREAEFPGASSRR